MIAITGLLYSDFLQYLANGTYTIWSQKMTDNIICDHNKLLILYSQTFVNNHLWTTTTCLQQLAWKMKAIF